jgi:hypothetical protein
LQGVCQLRLFFVLVLVLVIETVAGFLTIASPGSAKPVLKNTTPDAINGFGPSDLHTHDCVSFSTTITSTSTILAPVKALMGSVRLRRANC